MNYCNRGNHLGLVSRLIWQSADQTTGAKVIARY
jgi:hypothetical protein